MNNLSVVVTPQVEFLRSGRFTPDKFSGFYDIPYSLLNGGNIFGLCDAMQSNAGEND